MVHFALCGLLGCLGFICGGFVFVVGLFFDLNIVCSVQGSFSPFQVWSDFSLVGVSCFCIISLTAICV